LLKDGESQDYANVFGETYKEAEDTLRQIEYEIAACENKGFLSREQAAEFAKTHHMDVVVYMKSLGDFRWCTHRGDALVRTAWRSLYQSILYWEEENKKGDVERYYFTPSDYQHMANARVYGERTDGKYAPLYTRNYFVPTGYFDETTGTFNLARPFTTWAKDTGADTSYVHTLLRRIAGECYPYLLAWLRAKLINPTVKTEVVPIFVGAQGTGKSTFGEVICKALFGEDNVLVTDQYDATARFNADNADMLIVCLEEKSQEDKRNTSSSLKSRATSKKVRKENKGVDPIFQDSHTDFIMTTNELVPLKFEDRGDQRRFMVMEADPTFTIEPPPGQPKTSTNELAASIITQLYGRTPEGQKVCKSFLENKQAIEQFKHELWEGKNCEGINYKQFPKTEAYNRCFNIPRTNEAVEIEAIIKALAPFIRATLVSGSLQEKVTLTDPETGEMTMYLDAVLNDINAMQYVYKHADLPPRVAICRAVTFVDSQFNKPYAHSVVERTLFDMRPWLKQQGLILLGNTNPPNNGFKNIVGKAKHSPAAWFVLADDPFAEAAVSMDEETHKIAIVRTGVQAPTKEIGRLGERVRFNDHFIYDVNGEFETLNELKPGCFDRRAENAQYLDTFLLEADETTPLIAMSELRKLAYMTNMKCAISAEEFYAQRLAVQDQEADRLFNAGIVCRVVYSGSKSLHMLVRVADSPSNLDERNWLDAYLKSTLSSKLLFDASTKDPTRLTRAPIEKKRITKIPTYDTVSQLFTYDPNTTVIGTQRLLAEDWSNIYNINWRPMYESWKNMPKAYYEERGRMQPTKPIYKEAAIALLEGTFFTGKQFNGIRQETFFPAYRLLRQMGYTHDELWLEFAVGISQYPKKNEVTYWQTRKTCKLIKTIDEEVDSGRSDPTDPSE